MLLTVGEFWNGVDQLEELVLPEHEDIWIVRVPIEDGTSREVFFPGKSFSEAYAAALDAFGIGSGFVVDLA